MFNWTILKILFSFQSNNIDFSIRKSEPGTFEETRIGFHKTFRKQYLSLVQPNGLNLVMRLRLELSHS